MLPQAEILKFIKGKFHHIRKRYKNLRYFFLDPMFLFGPRFPHVSYLKIIQIKRNLYTLTHTRIFAYWKIHEFEITKFEDF